MSVQTPHAPASTAASPLTVVPRLPKPAVVVLPSRMDVHAVDAVTGEVRHALAHSASSLILDATAVKHLDQNGLDALSALCAAAKNEGFDLEIVPSTTLRVVVELTGSALLAERTDWAMAA